MASGNRKLADQVERLPLDSALKAAVLDGVANTDDETAAREADSLRALLDSLPQKLEAVRDAVARDPRRQRASRRVRARRAAPAYPIVTSTRPASL